MPASIFATDLQYGKPEREVRRPLVVDVDGTLIRGDLLHENVLQFAMQRPHDLWRLLPWMLHGKAYLKSRLSEAVEFDPFSLPFYEESLALIREVQALGHPVYLASASPRHLVEQIAVRLGGIAGIFASDENVNLSGQAKAERLVATFGRKGFDYVGNTNADIPVWREATGVLVVASTSAIERKVSRLFEDVEVIARRGGGAADYLQALRPHQWAKNLLLLVPVIAAHRLNVESLLTALLACVTFCLAASSAYILNDLLDLVADRSHPRKCQRPFAGGRIPVPHGVFLSALLLTGALALALLIGVQLLAILCCYIAGTVAYSLFLKREMIIDVITLSGLYTIRLFAGAAAVGTEISPWLLMFSLFLFFSLACVKRCSEIALNREEGNEAIVGRGYVAADFPAMSGIAAAAGIGAVLVFTLYLSSPEVALLYSHPARLWWATPILLGWICRIVMLSCRGAIHYDPVIFAMTDRISILIAGCMAIVLIAAL